MKKKTKLKVVSGQKGEQLKFNIYGVQLGIDKSNKSQMRERVQTLKKVIKTKKAAHTGEVLSDKRLKQAQIHLKWYSAELRKLG